MTINNVQTNLDRTLLNYLELAALGLEQKKEILRKASLAYKNESSGGSKRPFALDAFLSIQDAYDFIIVLGKHLNLETRQEASLDKVSSIQLLPSQGDSCICFENNLLKIAYSLALERFEVERADLAIRATGIEPSCLNDWDWGLRKDFPSVADAKGYLRSLHTNPQIEFRARERLALEKESDSRLFSLAV